MELILDMELETFDKFILKSPNVNIMQTSAWAKLKDGDWKPHYLGFKENDKIVACALLLERSAFLGYSMFYCSRGFAIDYHNEELLEDIIKLTKEYVKKEKGFLLRFDPELPLYKKDSRTSEIIEDNTEIFNIINKRAKNTGLDKSMDSTFQPRFQMVVNLKDGELKEKVKSKKRRLVNDNYIDTRGYKIIENTNVEGVKEFARLSHLTELKQGVALRNEDYFMKMYDMFKDSNNIKIFMAQVEIDILIEQIKSTSNKEEEINKLEEIKKEKGNIVNTNAIICIYGTDMVQMFYGASDDDFSRYKAGYKLHFHAMEDAQNLGYSYFNLGGVAGTLDDGLTRFKSEFHPELFEYVGDFDVVVNSFVYKLFIKGLPLMKKALRKIRKND
ncbi:MAG: peptidoglycan bridge formation glycyltransferase FemA/FemB family protein [Erysipelotrichales bacterium]